MDVFHFTVFDKLNYVHHTIDTYSGFSWATALVSEKADLVITHFLEVVDIMEIRIQIKMENDPAYDSNKMKWFLHIIKYATGISHNPTRQAIVERSNQTLKEILNMQTEETKSSETDYIVLY